MIERRLQVVKMAYVTFRSTGGEQRATVGPAVAFWTGKDNFNLQPFVTIFGKEKAQIGAMKAKGAQLVDFTAPSYKPSTVASNIDDPSSFHSIATLQPGRRSGASPNVL
jgi:hypothetical protein